MSKKEVMSNEEKMSAVTYQKGIPDYTPQDESEIEAVEAISVVAPPEEKPVYVPKTDLLDIQTFDIGANLSGTVRCAEDMDGVIITVRANGTNGNDAIRFANGGYPNLANRLEIAPRQTFDLPVKSKFLTWENPTANAHVATVIWWRGKKPSITS